MKNSGLSWCILMVCLFFSQSCEEPEDCGPIGFTSINFSNYSSVIIADNEVEDRFLVINSKTEYDKHVFIEKINAGDFNISTIDYSKYTLLIGKKKVNGVAGTLISESFEKDCSSNSFIYKAIVKNGGYTAVGNFIFGIIIPKNISEIAFHVELLN